MMCFVGREQRVRGDSSLKLSTKESNRSKIAAEDARATTEGEDVGTHIPGGCLLLWLLTSHLRSLLMVGRWQASKDMRADSPKRG